MKKTSLAIIALLSLIPFISNAQYLPLSAGASYPLTGTLLTNVYNANQIALNNNGNNYGFISNPSPNKWSLGYGPNPSTLATSVLTWNDNGNVGIGTTTPSAKLEINSGSGLTPLRAVGPSGYMLIDNVGSGESYYQANTFHQFQGSSGAAIVTMFANGKVGIGTTSPDEKLTVNGTIHSQEVKVDMSVPAPDYVFELTYKLPSLTEIKAFVDKNHHLPEIPSAAEMAKNGLDLGDMNMKLLKKVEELTLYLIQQKEEAANRGKAQQGQIDEMKKQIETLTKRNRKQIL